MYHIYIYIYIYDTYVHTRKRLNFRAEMRATCGNTWRHVATRAHLKTNWILCRGGCSGSGVQWIGVVFYSKIVYNIT